MKKIKHARMLGAAAGLTGLLLTSCTINETPTVYGPPIDEPAKEASTEEYTESPTSAESTDHENILEIEDVYGPPVDN